MNKIISIDKNENTMLAEAGCILQNLQEKADAEGLLFPMSIASEGSAELGGLIATNAGGTGVIRYGNMRDLVLGLQVVLADGSVIDDLSPLRKDNTGYDLKNIFIGAEGTLGIITAASLKIFPKPKEAFTIFAAVKDITKALECLKFTRDKAGDSITAFEIISYNAKDITVEKISDIANPISNGKFFLLIEISASLAYQSARTEIENIMSEMLEKNILADVVIAESIKQAEDFWNLREHIPEAIRKAGRGIHFDISIPIAKINDFCEKTEELLKQKFPELKFAVFGHLGDGNLHYNMYLPTETPPERFSMQQEKIKEIVYQELQEYGGSISAEHGIGLEKKDLLEKYISPVELQIMKKIKQALDPKNIMNPGKIFDL